MKTNNGNYNYDMLEEIVTDYSKYSMEARPFYNYEESGIHLPKAKKRGASTYDDLCHVSGGSGSGSTSCAYDTQVSINRVAGKKIKENASKEALSNQTGLHYYGYRYYDPVTGRWPSRDPIEEAGGVNIYNMVDNNLIDVYDIHGLISSRNRAAYDAACDCKKHADDTGNEKCTVICCDLETKAISTFSNKGTKSGCMMPRCPEGTKKVGEVHSHPGFKPAPSDSDNRGVKRENRNTLCLIATGGRLGGDPNIISITRFGSDPHGGRRVFYDCSTGKFVK